MLKTKTNTFIFVLEAPQDQDPGLEAYITCSNTYTAYIMPVAELTSCVGVGGRHNMPRPCKLIFDLTTLKVVSESHVTWATFVPILVFLGLSVLDLGLI